MYRDVISAIERALLHPCEMLSISTCHSLVSRRRTGLTTSVDEVLRVVLRERAGRGLLGAQVTESPQLLLSGSR
jgi:hypothetical protein